MNSSNQLIINEPPRFGLESRGRNKDINTRKYKELQKMKQLIVNEKAKKEEEKRLKKQPPKDPNQPKKIKSPQPNNLSQPRPPLVIGTDIDKESLYPQSQDYDRDEINPNELIYGTKKTVNGFQDDVILSFNQKERIEIQKAIEESIKEFVLASNVDKVVQEMEEDFVLCESESESESDDEKSIECWELMDEASSSHLVNLITTPYIRLNSDKEFPKLSNKPIHKQVTLTNPWNHSKHLIEAISQQS
ncbi:hypothetical protein PPL_09064 [Heterostelium album PN500]|uniref:Uncharacterized protein n=1 Tax=Heterostelium pallidum (strain ATCC 26659 / Pp 5 / PN500) TaxID=670386 RepID=D3BKI3_HETP5|nr:hypothetical protein PPL_09064 [Heterostelium album PN500]EFA78413.1 hypothetical protein PPL_09064 [Heterostelium album PN500]|eukprot:XP_020430538.1 hypothetical protein PPL_09064 [Heterostelium album PN500]